MRFDDLETLRLKIRNHPDFAEMSRRYVADLVAWHDDIGDLNRVVANIARLRILENLIYLHYGEPRTQGGHGASFERLTQLSHTYDAVGVRAVRTTLRLARNAGQVATARDPSDGRLRIFQPTAALVGNAKRYLAMTMRPLDRVFPHLRLVERLDAEPEFYFDLAATFGRSYLQRNPRWIPPGTPFHEAVRLEGAVPIFALIVDCFWNDRALPTAADLSRRFWTSQSQVRAVLKNVQASGLARLGPRGAVLDAAPLAHALIETRVRNLAAGARCILELVASGAYN